MTFLSDDSFVLKLLVIILSFLPLQLKTKNHRQKLHVYAVLSNLSEKLYLEMTEWLLIRMKLLLIQSLTDCVADRVKHLQDL